MRLWSKWSVDAQSTEDRGQSKSYVVQRTNSPYRREILRLMLGTRQATAENA